MVTREVNILIIGAGVAGEIIGNQIIKKQFGNLIGFLDDDTSKIGKTICGKPIFSAINSAKSIIDAYGITQVIIAIPSATGNVIKTIIQNLIDIDIEVKVVPGYFDLLDKDVHINYPLRNIEISDLLGRAERDLNIELISSYVNNKTVLITGGGGSIGSEIARLVSNLLPKTIVLMGKGENSIYEAMNNIRFFYPHVNVFPEIVNMTNKRGLEYLFNKWNPQVIFHAASHKHVPLLEHNPHEAFYNNVIGTRNLLELSDKHNVERFIQISTDKAVNPTSVMGATKRLVELLTITNSQKSKTLFCIVRFGNVLGSRGSVIPLFKKQIERGGPLTIRHPDTTRYFMTIPEASQLVLQAGAIAKGGEIFILDMGEPINICDMAKQMVKLYGLKVETDIKIVFTGLEKGEKLHEELLTSLEGNQSTSFKKIFITKPIEPNINKVKGIIEELENKLYMCSNEEMKELILKQVNSINM